MGWLTSIALVLLPVQPLVAHGGGLLRAATTIVRRVTIIATVERLSARLRRLRPRTAALFGTALRLEPLALRTGIPRDYLTECEAGKRKASVGREQVIARELGVHPIALRPCHEHFADCARVMRMVED